KCIIRLMKPLLIVLLIAGSLQAQSIVDAARKERQRQAQLKPGRVITSTETKVDEAKPASTADDQAKSTHSKAAPAAAPTAGQPSSKDASKPPDAIKPPTPAKPDPVEVWNNQVNQLRAKIRTVQDQELTLQLQLNQANNQVYAAVTDQATQDRAL